MRADDRLGGYSGRLVSAGSAASGEKHSRQVTGVYDGCSRPIELLIWGVDIVVRPRWSGVVVSMRDSLGVVIPAYDPDLSALTAYIAAIREQLAPAELRVEIDTPRDEQLAALEATTAEVNAVSHRRGKGGAITDGFDSLETDVLAFADADGSVPAASLAAVVRPVQEGTAAVSIGSRRHPEAEIVDPQTVVRRLLGDVFAAVARRLLPTRCYDYQCGAKALRAEAWSDIRNHCYEEGFAWDLEVLSIADSLGYEITELPVRWVDHPESTVDSGSTAVELATALVRVRQRTDRLTPRRLRDRQSADRSTDRSAPKPVRRDQ